MAKRKVVKVLTPPQVEEKDLDKELNYSFMNYINTVTQVRRRQAREERMTQTMEWTLLIGVGLVIIAELIS